MSAPGWRARLGVGSSAQIVPPAASAAPPPTRPAEIVCIVPMLAELAIEGGAIRERRGAGFDLPVLRGGEAVHDRARDHRRSAGAGDEPPGTDGARRRARRHRRGGAGGAAAGGAVTVGRGGGGGLSCGALATGAGSTLGPAGFVDAVSAWRIRAPFSCAKRERKS